MGFTGLLIFALCAYKSGEISIKAFFLTAFAAIGAMLFLYGSLQAI